MSSSTHELVTAPRRRPSTSLKIDDVESDLTAMKQQGHTNSQLLDWLKEQGIKASSATLERRLRNWGVRRKAAAQIDDQLAERVNWLFHHTLLNDTQIASRIAEEDGLATSSNQVKEVRQLFGWRRNQNRDSVTAHQLTTQNHIQSLIQQSLSRSFDRRWAITYLRHHFGHKAHQYNVTTVQKLYNPTGVANRLPNIVVIKVEMFVKRASNPVS
jgi:hypothetical protein